MARVSSDEFFKPIIVREYAPVLSFVWKYLERVILRCIKVLISSYFRVEDELSKKKLLLKTILSNFLVSFETQDVKQVSMQLFAS